MVLTCFSALQRPGSPYTPHTPLQLRFQKQILCQVNAHKTGKWKMTKTFFLTFLLFSASRNQSKDLSYSCSDASFSSILSVTQEMSRRICICSDSDSSFLVVVSRHLAAAAYVLKLKNSMVVSEVETLFRRHLIIFF